MKAGTLLAKGCALALPLFVLVEVNYPLLTPPGRLAVFAALGLALCFLGQDEEKRAAWDLPLAALALVVCSYMAIQSESWFSGWWLGGRSLGDRAGLEQPLDIVLGTLGLVLVVEAARRSIGLALPILALAFVAYAAWGSVLPSWLLPHRGYSLERIVGQTFLHNQGVFGVAMKVMFSYVFLFVVFGALLEATGATRFIVDAARGLLSRSVGGSAKVAVLSSGLMGSLSGSAVANTATTGTFTIPMMRSAGFSRHVAAGVEAAASSGGALVPPVMGAGAYMMLEIIEPQVTYLQIVRAALLPACLYYFSIFLIVHFHARRLKATEPVGDESQERAALLRYEGVVFVSALGSLIACLIGGFTVFRAVSVALGVVVALSFGHARTRLTVRSFLDALTRASRNGVPLVAAAACVGIVIGVVTLTGVGSRLPAMILPLAQDHLILALAVIMLSSIVLGMGLPSAVCYLLMATLIGPVLSRLGVVPLAAHLFIFYFGMMSMVTPPVALAAYAASSIAGSKLFQTSYAAFRFALVGFLLPFMFVFRPQLLMLSDSGDPAGWPGVLAALILAVLGVVPFAAAITGFLRRRLTVGTRMLLFAAAGLSFYPGGSSLLAAVEMSLVNVAGVTLFLAVVVMQLRPAGAAYSS